MARKTLTIARQVQCRSVLPVRAKDGCYAPSLAARPLVKRQDTVTGDVPEAARWGDLGISGAIQAQDVLALIPRRDRNEGMRPGDADEPPAALQPSKAKRRSIGVRLESPLVRGDHTARPAAPFTR